MRALDRVPAIGPNWGQRDPTDPRNRGRRGSLLVEVGPVAILVDMSPDLREQLIDARVGRIDAVVMTHVAATVSSSNCPIPEIGG